MKPLSGIRVVELGEHVSAPFCGKLLADFGAEVVKVELPGRGDIARNYGPFPKDKPHPEKSGLFLLLNTNKKGITLNWKVEAGAEILRRLIQLSDVVVENFSPGTLENLGLGYEALKSLNPRVILTSISYFGGTGPYRGFRGADIVIQAMGGLMWLTGLPERPPLKLPGPQADYQAGLFAAIATLAALILREETGRGQHIDISEMEVVASLLEGALLSYAYSETIRKRRGAPPRARCRDGELILPPELYQEDFGHLVSTLSPPELKEHAAKEVFHQAQEWRLPVAPVREVTDSLADPQLRSRGFWQEVEHPFMGRVTLPTSPFKVDQGWAEFGRAPLLGEHNEELYCGWLGYSKEELAELKAGGII